MGERKIKQGNDSTAYECKPCAVLQVRSFHSKVREEPSTEKHLCYNPQLMPQFQMLWIVSLRSSLLSQEA